MHHVNSTCEKSASHTLAYFEVKSSSTREERLDSKQSNGESARERVEESPSHEKPGCREIDRDRDRGERQSSFSKRGQTEKETAQREDSIHFQLVCTHSNKQ